METEPMAATLVSRAYAEAQNLKSKFIAATGIALAIDGTARQDNTTAPTITAGTGAPTEAAPNGSLYLRTDGTDADDSVYVRAGGAWIAHKGQTA